MTCNICFDDNTQLIKKTCCTFNICVTCYTKQKNNGKNTCPQCGKNIVLTNDIINSTDILNNTFKISANDAITIVQSSEQFKKQQQQRQLLERTQHENLQKFIQISEIIIAEIYEEIRTSSNLGLRKLKYKKRIQNFGEYTEEMQQVITNISNEFEVYGYNVNIDCYTHRILSLYSKKSDIICVKLSW